jgi:hypothetical protein
MHSSNILQDELALLQQEEPTAELVTRYIFAHLQARHGTLWYGSRRAGSPAYSPRERLSLSPLETVRAYQLYSVAGDAHGGLLGWLEGRYPLVPRLDVPTPTEMLNIQCEGRRYVTILFAWEEQFRIRGRHAGALEFLLHDLEHAHKFFADEELCAAQIRFFRLLAQTQFPDFDEDFVRELDYVRADMNSHPVHMFKYLKAILVNAFKRQDRLDEFDSYCEKLFRAWGLPLDEALRINSPGQERPEDAVTVAEFFGFDRNTGP